MPAGRPRLEIKAETRLQARCYLVDDIRWRADAARAGKSYSEWIRHCLDLGGGRDHQQPKVTPARKKVEAGVPARVEPVAPEPARTSQARPAALSSPPGGFVRMRDTARDMAQASGKCTADVARGTRCKLCGKIH